MLNMITKSRARRINRADDYASWQEAALAHDNNHGLHRWRARDESELYDFIAVTRRLNRLKALRQAGKDRGLMHALNEGIHGNMDGIGNSRLYNTAKFGTKFLVEDYVREITSALAYLADNKTPSISQREKVDFFQRATHCFGRTGLLLSGAGTLLYFHVGVLKALVQQELLPSIISGSSGGAWVAAFVGTRTREQFLAELDTIKLADDPRDSKDKAWYEHLIGATISKDYTVEKIAELIPDLTFQEAYELSGIQINISISPTENHQKARLLSATTSPTAYIREAVMASSAVPGIFPAVTLMARNENGEREEFLRGSRWMDGSLTGDLPIKRLARLYGVNHTIVSQTNPLILPFVDSEKEPSGVINVTKQMGFAVSKNTSLALSRMFKRPLSTTKLGRSLINGFISVVRQSYTGDITILPRDKIGKYNPFTWLSEKSQNEVDAMVSDGERATWPEVERIRNQTLISRELDRIIMQYDQDVMRKRPKKVNSKKSKKDK